jgi:hypothetical protein
MVVADAVDDDVTRYERDVEQSDDRCRALRSALNAEAEAGRRALLHRQLLARRRWLLHEDAEYRRLRAAAYDARLTP